MSKPSHGGKGSTPRKRDNPKQYDDNWDKIFGKKEKAKKKPPVDKKEINYELYDERDLFNS